MSAIRRILITGDDGYNSIGTRLLVHFLKSKYELTIVGTKTQQTAVGGKLHVREGGSYLETTMDGVSTFCIDGAPCDAMEFARAYFGKKSFDLLLSGVNMGENIGSGVISSGTVSASLRGLAWEIAPQGISLSWETPPEFFFMKHDEKESIRTYLDYPGEVISKTLKCCFEQHLWGAKLLNINFPRVPAFAIRFVRFEQSLDNCYPPVAIHEDSRTFSYPFSHPLAELRKKKNPSLDVNALSQGYITITPQMIDWTEEELYSKLREEQISL